MTYWWLHSWTKWHPCPSNPHMTEDSQGSIRVRSSKAWSCRRLAESQLQSLLVQQFIHVQMSLLHVFASSGIFCNIPWALDRGEIDTLLRAEPSTFTYWISNSWVSEGFCITVTCAVQSICGDTWPEWNTNNRNLNWQWVLGPKYGRALKQWTQELFFDVITCLIIFLTWLPHIFIYLIFYDPLGSYILQELCQNFCYNLLQ